MILVGDVGGTKTDLAIFSLDRGPREPLAQQLYESERYPSLEAIIRDFLNRTKTPIDHACFAVAGPVIEGRCKITNLHWNVDLSDLKKELDMENVALINDLQAIALAVPILEPDELAVLNEGEALPGGAIAVIAPGTGMGEAFLTWDGTRYEAHASEGGHADFAPGDDIEIGLLKYMQERFSHVSIERVCSGRGLPNIYDYLRDSGYAPESPELAAALAQTEDRAPIIVERALDSHNPPALCVATLDIFIAIMGAEAGNLALKVLSTGGVYLAGGIPPKILPSLQHGRFVQAFLRKGRLSDLLSLMPIHVILSRAALLGVANYGLQLSREKQQA